jgi:hypothetical protein
MKHLKIYDNFQLSEKKKPGLWDNIRKKRAKGEKPAEPGDEDYPDKEAWKDATEDSKKDK